jgi:hypothetical protein
VDLILKLNLIINQCFLLDEIQIVTYITQQNICNANNINGLGRDRRINSIFTSEQGIKYSSLRRRKKKKTLIATGVIFNQHLLL